MPSVPTGKHRDNQNSTTGTGTGAGARGGSHPAASIGYKPTYRQNIHTYPVVEGRTPNPPHPNPRPPPPPLLNFRSTSPLPPFTLRSTPPSQHSFPLPASWTKRSTKSNHPLVSTRSISARTRVVPGIVCAVLHEQFSSVPSAWLKVSIARSFSTRLRTPAARDISRPQPSLPPFPPPPLLLSPPPPPPPSNSPRCKIKAAAGEGAGG